MNKEIKIIIIDDHAMVREGLKQVLNSEPDIRVIGEAGDGREGLRVVEKKLPDVVVLDVSMPGMGGLEAISSLREISPKLKIIVLSMHGKESLAREALRAGASAYILKGDSGDELVTAIHAVCKGDYYFSAPLRAALVSSYIGRPAEESNADYKKYQELTERERQFFRLMLGGHSTAKISELLEISYKTGQKHHTSIVKKLGTGNSMEMVRLALKLGLVEPDFFED